MKDQNFFSAAINAFNGLMHVLSKSSGKRELLVIFFFLCLFALRPSSFTLSMLALSLVLLAFECLNFAIEVLCDHIEPNYNEYIKKIKDSAAAASLIISLLLGLVLVLYAIKELGYATLLVELIIEALRVLRYNIAEYLFFVGAFVLFLHWLQNKRWIKAGGAFLAATLWFLFYKPISDFIKPIGVDSLMESTHFDWHELVFYLGTVRGALTPHFSFDYEGIVSMETLAVAKKLRWNTWHVEAKAFDKISPERFGLVILSNEDPNNR